MLYAIILLNNRKIDSQNVTSVFCCIKNWRRQLIGTKGRNLRKKSSSTISNFCVSLFQLCLFYFSPFLQESPLLLWPTLQRWIYPPWKQSMPPQGWVLWQFSGGVHSLRCSKQTWNTQREFTNMAAHRNARTQEECTTQFCWRCFGSGTAFTDVGNWDQHYSRGMHAAWHLSTSGNLKSSWY